MKYTYYVVFSNCRTKYLKFLKDGFRHVFIVRKIGKYGLMMEDTFEGFYVNLIELKELEVLTKREKWTLIKVVKGEKSKKRFSIWYWAPTCVNFVKNVLGLHCRAQTPYQLYNYLLSKECKKWVTQSQKQLKKL